MQELVRGRGKRARNSRDGGTAEKENVLFVQEPNVRGEETLPPPNKRKNRSGTGDQVAAHIEPVPEPEPDHEKKIGIQTQRQQQSGNVPVRPKRAEQKKRFESVQRRGRV